MTAPAVSVVVATRDRAPRLEALLRALAGQRGVEAEVIVVDDGSGDATPGVLTRAPDGLALRVVRNPRPLGPAAARNAGWPLAQAPLVAFTDDDCVPEPGWLAALAGAHERHPGALLQGRTEPMAAEAHLQAAFTRSQLVTALGPHFQACNIAYPRQLLDRLGGFDESFEHFGEDADLAWRALEAGAEAVFVDAAGVEHAVHDLGPVGAIRGSQRWAGSVRAFARHPGLRDSLVNGVFWRRSHRDLLLALGGAALARRTRGVSLALAAPYVRGLRSSHGSYAGVTAALPAHVAVDAAETVAMARGAARFRTPIL
jgi:glycosyltransferase involved in cell wall biosynthesis